MLNCRNSYNLPEIHINDCWFKNSCESCNSNKLQAMSFDDSLSTCIIIDDDDDDDIDNDNDNAKVEVNYGTEREEYNNYVNDNYDRRKNRKTYIDEILQTNGNASLSITMVPRKRINSIKSECYNETNNFNAMTLSKSPKNAPIESNGVRNFKLNSKPNAGQSKTVYNKTLKPSEKDLIKLPSLEIFPLKNESELNGKLNKFEQKLIINNAITITDLSRFKCIDLEAKTENETRMLTDNKKQQIPVTQKLLSKKPIKTTVIEIHTEDEPLRIKNADQKQYSDGDDDSMYEYNEELQACCEISLNETTEDHFEPSDEKDSFNVDDFLDIHSEENYDDEIIKIKTEQKSIYNVNKNINSNTTANNNYQCPMCMVTFRNKFKLDAHLSAKVCTRFNSNKSNLPEMFHMFSEQDRNIERSTRNQPVEFDPDAIVFNIAPKSKISNAYKLTKPYECDICHRHFSSRLVIEKHFMKKHSASIVQSCRICEKEFPTAKLLRRHWRTHEAGPFKCKICAKELSGLIGLEMHMRIHTGERPFKCKICFRSFAQTSSLSCHVRTHTGEKPYQCSICHKAFSQSSSLAAHRYVHTGLKPYKCEYCQKDFAIRPQLRKHIANRHSGTKPFKCDLCGKTYIQKLSLRYHMQRHNQQNLLYCKYCPKTFVRPVCLNLHTARMHSQDANGRFRKNKKASINFSNSDDMHIVSC